MVIRQPKRSTLTFATAWMGAVATFQATLASTRTGRASVHMLYQVKVDYYGTHTPITQLARVSTPEAQLILISPWDPTVIKDMEKALLLADLGLNPMSDGQDHPHPRASHDRGAPPRRLQAPQQGPRRAPHRHPQTSAATATTPSRRWPRIRRSRRTKKKRSQEEIQKMTDEEIRRIEELLPQKRSRSHAGVRASSCPSNILPHKSIGPVRHSANRPDALTWSLGTAPTDTSYAASLRTESSPAHDPARRSTPPPARSPCRSLHSPRFRRLRRYRCIQSTCASRNHPSQSAAR
jgi:ribosome recycling factor